MKRKILVVMTALAAFGLTNAFSAGASQNVVKEANHRTALRCLALAKDYASAKNWQAVISQTSLGISYDKSMSDLWYMMAVAQNNLGFSKNDIETAVKKSLDENKWVDYNRDSARVLYADILCDTLRYNQVFDVIDGTVGSTGGNGSQSALPYVYSSDAEYIRAKAYYRLGDAASVTLARRKVESSRKMYPNDNRFPLLFFTYEKPEALDTASAKTAGFFLAQISQYVDPSPDVNAELEVKASLFAQGKSREQLLKSFAARGIRHPLYAVSALEAGLITQGESFEYIRSFADTELDYNVLERYLPLLTEEDVIETAAQYFSVYAGVLVADTNKDGLSDLYVKYSDGRPQSIFHDSNQDGVNEWTIVCDFGAPVAATVTEDRIDVKWGDFPSLKSVEIKNHAKEVIETFDLVEGELSWSPVRIDTENKVSSVLHTQFYWPRVKVDTALVLDGEKQHITLDRLVSASKGITIPSQERENASIHFYVLEGEIVLADYSQNGRRYAQAQFEKGLPYLRVVDVDGDGIFETTEYYAVDMNGDMEVHTLEDERTIMTNVFGLPSNGCEFYLRMVQVDSADDDDTLPDYTEEYTAHGGKICSWDTNGDGNWNLRYVRSGRDKDGSFTEQSLFYAPDGSLVTVTLKDGVPQSVAQGDSVRQIIEDDRYKFYWIGPKGSPELAKEVLSRINARGTQGSSVIVDAGDSGRVLGIRIGSTCYGTILKNGGTDEN